MGVVRIIDGEWTVKHAATLETCPGGAAMNASGASASEDDACGRPCPLSIWSPRMRPAAARSAGSTTRRPSRPVVSRETGDSRRRPGDPLGAVPQRGDVPGGGVWLHSSTPRVFTDEHQGLLHPIAALLGTAVEHWRIWDAERRRRDRVDRIEEPLRTLTQSLDVAEVFPRLSEQMQPILPHHMMVLTELDVRAHAMRIVAAAGHGDSPYPTETVTLTPGEQERRVDVEIIHDLQKEIAPDTERQRLAPLLGDALLAPGARLGLGRGEGGLSFFHREPSQFQHEDIEIAWRLADRIALARSMRRLAEEARVAAEA